MARRYVLIGAGPAAISAAEEIRRVDPDGRTIAFCGDAHGYYSRPGLAYYLAHDVPEAQLHPFSRDDFSALGLEIRHAQVEGFDPDAHAVSLGDGTTIEYDRLLVATGSSAIRPRLPGAELDGVVKLDDVDDARDLVRRCRGKRTAVVAGGGITALEIVEGMRSRGSKVHYLMRKDRYWSDVLSEQESRLVQDELAAGGVVVHPFTELAEVRGSGGRVVGVRTATGQAIACDIVGIAIGVRPRIELPQSAGLECNRGVLVDRFMRTSAEDVFSAGDVAEVHDPAAPGPGLDVLWASAVAKGRVAGHNMAADVQREYRESIALNVSRLGGIQVTIVGAVGHGGGSDLEGISRGDSQRWRELGQSRTIESQLARAHVRIELSNGVLAGAVVMGDQQLSRPLQDLVESRAPVADALDDGLGRGVALDEVVQTLWEERVASGA